MLSGGERNRLLLARLFARPSNLLVMDEPTNDLDAETLELLEEMVANYAGTLLLVSHDRAFLDNVVTSTLVFEGAGRVNEYVGGYTDWVRQRKSRAPKAQVPAARCGHARGGAGCRARGARASPLRAAPRPRGPRAGWPPPLTAQPRRLSCKERRACKAMPEKIQRLELEQAELQAAIADPALFQGNDPRGAAALQKLQSLAAELEHAYARWDALETRGRRRPCRLTRGPPCASRRGSARPVAGSALPAAHVPTRRRAEAAPLYLRGRPRPSRSLGFGSEAPAASGMTSDDACSRRNSWSSRMVCCTACSAAAPNLSTAALSVTASSSKLMGTAPIGVMTCACPTNITGRAESAAPSAVTGVRRRMVPTSCDR